MALQKTIQTIFGFEIKNAYIRIEGVRVNKNSIQFQARASVNSEKPHFLDTQYDCAYSLDGENPIKQAYEYLKTLPEFAGAVDC